MTSCRVFVAVSGFVFASSAFAAGMTSQRKLGNVVAIERAFKVDLNDCEKTYRKDSPMHAVCKVVLLPSVPMESWGTGDSYSAFVKDGQGRKVSLGVETGKNMYKIDAYSSEGGDVSFASMRDGIKGLIESLPNQEIKAIIHTIE